MPSQPVAEMLEVTLLRLLVAGLIGVDQYGVPNFSFPFRSAAPPSSGGIGGTTGTTDNAILRADGTGGSTLQGSLATINDSGGIIATTLQINTGGLLRNGTLGIGGVELTTISQGAFSNFTVNTLKAFSGTIIIGATPLVEDAANVLALRNGANAQTLNVYGTFTDSGNYSALQILSGPGGAYIYFIEAGSGVSEKDLHIRGDTIDFESKSGTIRWEVDLSGNFLSGSDNAYTIGASGAAPSKVTTHTLNISSIPTSSSGLSSGDVWSNLGILTIVS